MKRVLITGGCGFIGSHIVEHILKNTDWEVVVLDRLNYASRGFDRLRDMNCYDNERIHRLTADFTRPIADGLAYEIGRLNYILHLGAETHVDNSIDDPRPFVRSNVFGTMEMLEFAKQQPSLEWMIYFSTDEVFGPAPNDKRYAEWDRYDSTNPYAATKAAGEELCLAYANTYKLPVMISHCMNAMGERQSPEKMIPSTIRKVLDGEKVIIHADPTRTKPGSRFYIHCRNIADAVLFLLEHGQQRDKYNIVGEQEVNNLDLAAMIAEIIGKPLSYELVSWHESRPGHDLRYALDGAKLAGMGWKPPRTFMDSLEKTVEWTLNNKRWLYPQEKWNGGLNDGSQHARV